MLYNIIKKGEIRMVENEYVIKQLEEMLNEINEKLSELKHKETIIKQTIEKLEGK